MSKIPDGKHGDLPTGSKGVAYRVVFFCILFSLECAVNVLSSVTRDTIFLRTYDSRYISHMALLMSVATAYVTTFVTSLADKGVSQSTISACCPIVSAVCLVILNAALIWAKPLTYVSAIVLYLCVEISNQLLAQQFWDMCSKAFNVAESKKYFGSITFGSTIGTLLASFAIIPVLQYYEFKTEFNLLAIAIIQGIIGCIMFIVGPQFSDIAEVLEKKKQRDSNTKKSTKANHSILNDIKKREYMLHICLFEFGATVVRVLVDYRTLSILSQYPEAIVKSSLSTINGIQSFFMMPLQLLSGPLFIYFGVMYGISLLPVTIILFGVITFSTNSYHLLILSRALYNGVSHAIFNPARELLWLPLNVNERMKLKAFVTGPFRSIARICGALTSIALTNEFAQNVIGPSSVSVLTIVLGLLWLLDTFGARKAYATEFYSSLKKGYLDLTSPLLDFTTDQIMLVKSTLITGDANQIAFLLNVLQPTHIKHFYKELRDMFYCVHRDGTSIPSLHTKLKLIQIHINTIESESSDTENGEYVGRTSSNFYFHSNTIIAKRQNVTVTATTDDTSNISGCRIFNIQDYITLLTSTHPATPFQDLPRQLRTALVLACGYETSFAYEDDKAQCCAILSTMLDQHIEHDTHITVAISVALLRLTNWMHDRANLILQKLLHGEQDTENKVICLRIVGRELPELIGNGFVIYLLRNANPRIVHAALDCCRYSVRNATMLIPSLISLLCHPLFRSETIECLLHFNPLLVWEFMIKMIDEQINKLQTSIISNSSSVSNSTNNNNTTLQLRDPFIGGCRLIENGQFLVEAKFDLLLNIIEAIIDTMNPIQEGIIRNSNRRASLEFLLNQAVDLIEIVIDTLLRVIRESSIKVLASNLSVVHKIDRLTGIEIFHAYELNYVNQMIRNETMLQSSLIQQQQSNTSTTTTTLDNCSNNSNISNNSRKKMILDSIPTNHNSEVPSNASKSLLIPHLEDALERFLRIILKLESIKFPSDFQINVIIDALHSDDSEVLSAVQEVLESLLSSTHKQALIPLYFPNTTNSNTSLQLAAQAEEIYKDLSTIDLIRDGIHSTRNKELACLCLEYYINNLYQVLQWNSYNHVNICMQFEPQVITDLVQFPIAKELITEAIMSNSQLSKLFTPFLPVMDYQKICNEVDTKFKLLTTFEMINCLRVSILFQTISVTELLQYIANSFTQFFIPAGQTFVQEGELATYMYIVASGRVCMNKGKTALIELEYGACVGELALLQNYAYAGKNPASVSAVEDSIVLGISRLSLDKLMESSSAIAKGVLDALALSLKWSYNQTSSTLNAAVYASSPPYSESIRLRHLVQASVQSLSSNVLKAQAINKVASKFLSSIGRTTTTTNNNTTSSTTTTSTSTITNSTSNPMSTSHSNKVKSMPILNQRRNSVGLSFDSNHENNTLTLLLPSNSSPLLAFPTLQQSIQTSIQSSTHRSSKQRSMSLYQSITMENEIKNQNHEYSHLEKCIYLKGSQLFQELEDERVSMIALLVQTKVFEYEDVLYRDTTMAKYLYIIIQGRIQVEILNENEHTINNNTSNDTRNITAGMERAIVKHFEKGDCFGEESFIQRANYMGTATVKCSTPCVVFEISTETFVELAEKNTSLMHIVLAWLSNKITSHTESIVYFPSLYSSSRSPIGSPRAFNAKIKDGFFQPNSTAQQQRRESMDSYEHSVLRRRMHSFTK